MDQAIAKFVSELTPGGWGVWIAVVYYITTNSAKMFNGWVSMRKLSLEEKQANREGFTKQVDALNKQVSSMQGEVDGLRTENRNLRAEYDQHRRVCQVETEQLRNEIIRLEGVLAGMFRKVAAVALKVTRGEVDKNSVTAILELAMEAQAMSDGRDITAVRKDNGI